MENTTGFYFKLPQRQLQSLRDISDRSSLTVSELMRRMIDSLGNPTVFNTVVPLMSGQFVCKG